jgi:AcrR family transcriptional regulator
MTDLVPFYVASTDAPAKRAILETSLALFAERGVDGVTVRDIAERTGFTNPALFRHFPSKEALALALFEVCYRRLLGALSPTARNGGLQEALTRTLMLVEEAPEAVHFVLENLRRFFRQLPDELRARSILGNMRRLLAAERKAGRIGAHVDLDLAAAMVLGTLAQIARMHHFGELAQPPSSLSGDLFALFAKGIGR